MRKISNQEKGDGHHAVKEVETIRFMDELLTLIRSHRMALVPSHQGETSLHDSLKVVPLTDEVWNFHKSAAVFFEVSETLETDNLLKEACLALNLSPRRILPGAYKDSYELVKAIEEHLEKKESDQSHPG